MSAFDPKRTLWGRASTRNGRFCLWRVPVDHAVRHDQANGVDVIAAGIGGESLLIGAEDRHVLQRVTIDKHDVGIKRLCDYAALMPIGIVLPGQYSRLDDLRWHDEQVVSGKLVNHALRLVEVCSQQIVRIAS